MRIAILGCGSIGRRHARNLRGLGADDLVLFDPDPASRLRVEEELSMRPVASLDEVWDRAPSVAFVTAPSDQHVRLALEAARHGCHLFIEKPLSHSLDGLDDLAAEVEARGLISMVACNMRFHPGPARVKRLLEQGAVGQPIAARLQSGSYLPRWRPDQDYRRSYSASPESGGAVLDVIHEIDLALWYLGPARVVAAATLPADSIGLETDGLAEVLLRHDLGALSSVHLNFVQRDYRRSAQLICTEGTLYWDFERGRVEVYGAEGKLRQVCPQPEGWSSGQMFVDEVAHFLERIREGRPTTNPLTGGRAALEIALAARRPAGRVEG